MGKSAYQTRLKRLCKLPYTLPLGFYHYWEKKRTQGTHWSHSNERHVEQSSLSGHIDLYPEQSK
jgi:hypothetical protein